MFNIIQVYQSYLDTKGSFYNFWMRRGGIDSMSISPFNRTCVGITTREQYAVVFRVKSKYFVHYCKIN